MTAPTEITFRKAAEIRCRTRWLIPAALLAMIVCVPACWVLTGLLQRGRTVPDGSASWVLTALVVLVPLHELVHALACMAYSNMPWHRLEFGIAGGNAYCHVTEPVTVRVYRHIAMAPLLWLSGLCLVLLAVYPAFWLGTVTGLHLAGCAGDVWILWALRRCPPDALVWDLPTEAGCDVYEPAATVTAA